ncbi:MAG: DUF4910 domain-containing protein [Caldilineaceae bacterium]
MAKQALSNVYTQTGREMYSLMAELYPICRSITGDGVRQTLHRIQKLIPMVIREVPSGTQVFDWTVPNEWNVTDAWVKNGAGEKVIDFQRSNLHLLNYSTAIHRTLSLSELRPHLHTLSSQPNVIPYRTSYYQENWGFCLSQQQFDALPDGHYEVCIDTTLQPGSLSYGESYLQGEIEDEILISCHVCHPSLCNDNLSGVVLATFLARHMMKQTRRYSYRFLFIPGTIGSITWLAQNEKFVNRIKHGLVVACVGDGGHMHYKKSRRGDAEIDQVVQQVLAQSGERFEVHDFSPYGYDERQYCSPGFNMPVGSLTRTPHGRFAQYHTSADNLDFVKPQFLAHSYETYLAVFQSLEERSRLSSQLSRRGFDTTNRSESELDLSEFCYLNIHPKCEPQLGRRGLFRAFGGHKDQKRSELAMLWLLNYSDGEHTLGEIAQLSSFDLTLLHSIAQTLVEHQLLKQIV